MTKKQTNQIVEFSQQGYSVRDIADVLRLDRQQVEQILERTAPRLAQTITLDEDLYELNIQILDQDTAQDSREEFEEIAENRAGSEPRATSTSSADLKTLRDHLNELLKKDQELTELGQRIKQEQEELNTVKAGLPQQREAYETYQQRMFKEKVLARYIYLVDELLNDSTNSRWKGVEVDAYLEQLETLRQKLTQFCHFNRVDERGLVIYAGLGFLITLVDGIQKKQTKGFFASTSVLFNLRDEVRTQIKSFIADQFEQEIAQPTAPANPLDLLH